MKVAAVVPSVNRQESLLRCVRALQAQSSKLSQLVLSLPSADGVPESIASDPSLTIVLGAKGASAQRNAGVSALAEDTDVVAFLDDDSVVRGDFVEALIDAFGESGDLIALTGRVARNGAEERRALSVREIEDALRTSYKDEATNREPRPCRNLYGCNMALRYRTAKQNPFDEDLVLYSWLEDLDLSRRIAGQGSIIYDPRCVAVHEGNASGGRTQHLRFGYSSVANPVHLYRKKSISGFECVGLIAKPTFGNLAGLRGELAKARLNRLHGQGLAIFDLLRNELEPRRILDL